MSFVVKSVPQDHQGVPQNVSQYVPLYYQLKCVHCNVLCGVFENEIQERSLVHRDSEGGEVLETIKEYLWKCPNTLGGCGKENVEMFSLPNPKKIISQQK